MRDPDVWRGEGRVAHVFVDGDVHDVFVWEGGPATGAVITLVHGASASSHDWAGLVDRLTPEHRVVAPDLLGAGGSPPEPDGSGSVAAQADMLEELWRQLGVRRTRVVAHDVGTAVVAELLVRAVAGPRPTEIVDVVWCNGPLGTVVPSGVPVRVVWGVDDPVSGRGVLDVVRAAVPQVEVTEVDAGHSPHIERPDVVADVVLAPGPDTGRLPGTAHDPDDDGAG